MGAAWGPHWRRRGAAQAIAKRARLRIESDASGKPTSKGIESMPSCRGRQPNSLFGNVRETCAIISLPGESVIPVAISKTGPSLRSYFDEIDLRWKIPNLDALHFPVSSALKPKDARKIHVTREGRSAARM